MIVGYVQEILEREPFTPPPLNPENRVNIFGTLGMFGNGHHKWCYKLAQNFDLYLDAKKENRIYPKYC